MLTLTTYEVKGMISPDGMCHVVNPRCSTDPFPIALKAASDPSRPRVGYLSFDLETPVQWKSGETKICFALPPAKNVYYRVVHWNCHFYSKFRDLYWCIRVIRQWTENFVRIPNVSNFWSRKFFFARSIKLLSCCCWGHKHSSKSDRCKWSPVLSKRNIIS